MSHEIDHSTGTAAFAHVGAPAWHKLGQQLQKGATIDQWRQAAGLAYNVERAPVQFQYPSAESQVDDGFVLETFKGRQVLFRSDTKAPLSVVSDDYKVVQPDEVLDFFAKVAEIGGFELETAGVLSGGRRIWGLARINDGAPIIGHDHIRPYLLLATSYDATMATIAKTVAERVVCHNTITIAVNESDAATKAGVKSTITVPHNTLFKPDEIRQQLGIFTSAWEKWLIETRMLAATELTDAQADEFVFKLVRATAPKPKDGLDEPDHRQSKAYQKIMALFNGELIGAEEAGGKNAWALLNACTEWVDHHQTRRGTPEKQANTNLESSWFGQGDAFKSLAQTKLVQACREIA
jgi:phage/plasmid-like protein (TIGR03299 family)